MKKFIKPIIRIAISFAVFFAVFFLIECFKIRIAAHFGNAESQCALGEFYMDGINGFQQDYVQAAKWLRKAAEQGHSEAQNNLGLLYSQGNGVPQDPVEAVKWYRKAAEQGLDIAWHTL